MSTSPGPWRWKPVDQLDRGGYPSEMPILLDCNGKEVCNFGDDTRYYPTEGTPPGAEDAALITSAPQLAADLAEAVALLREHRPGMCLCGHGESCSVCSRPPKAYALDAKVAAFLARVDAR